MVEVTLGLGGQPWVDFSHGNDGGPTLETAGQATPGFGNPAARSTPPISNGNFERIPDHDKLRFGPTMFELYSGVAGPSASPPGLPPLQEHDPSTSQAPPPPPQP